MTTYECLAVTFSIWVNRQTHLQLPGFWIKMDQTTFDKFLEKTTKASFHNEVMRMVFSVLLFASESSPLKCHSNKYFQVYAAESDIASQLNEKRGR